ncbi:MAG: hypothetical protein AAFN41_08330 [Planctomycetota bacterium]
MDDQLRPILERMAAELTGLIELLAEAFKKLPVLCTRVGELKG